jgi:uncharacterized protein RhaS with RHS repeats
VQGGDSVSYGYDLRSNRASMEVTGEENYTIEYSYDLNNRLLDDEKSIDAGLR